MNESTLLQILSLSAILIGTLVAGLGYWSITQELKRAEPNGNLTQALWVVVAAALLVGLIGLWGEVQVFNLKKPTPGVAAPSTVQKTTPITGVIAKAQEQAPSAADAQLQATLLKQQVQQLEQTLAQYRALQKAFAENREKWQQVLDRAAVIAGPIRPDVQTELKAIRDQLDVKLVEEKP